MWGTGLRSGAFMEFLGAIPQRLVPQSDREESFAARYSTCMEGHGRLSVCGLIKTGFRRLQSLGTLEAWSPHREGLDFAHHETGSE